MKIACWNVNSIKSRLTQVLSWIEQHDPDVILFQELKCEEESFPLEAFSHLPYNFAISGQKTYNGVAILSKYKIDGIKKAFPGSPCPDQARFIEISFASPIGYCRIISIYVPNGGEIHSDKFMMKLEFLDALYSYLHSIKNTEEHVIIGGDFNVAPFDIDVYAPKQMHHTTCFTLEERVKLRAILNSNWTDLYRALNPATCDFTWWDYRGRAFEHNHGMRIDMILGCPKTADRLQEFIIDKDARSSDKASDHAPIMAVL